jgi:hypothetical protein
MGWATFWASFSLTHLVNLDVSFTLVTILSIRVARWFVFKTKNSNLGEFSRAIDWKKWICVMAIWSIVRTFGIFYDHLVHFAFIWYIFSVFGIMDH